jgi:hypothetical protein
VWEGGKGAGERGGGRERDTPPFCCLPPPPASRSKNDARLFARQLGSDVDTADFATIREEEKGGGGRRWCRGLDSSNRKSSWRQQE